MSAETRPADTYAGSPSASTDPSPHQPLSKNQLKKLAKREAYLAAKPARRKAEKEKRKAKAAERKAAEAAEAAARVEGGEAAAELERRDAKRRKVEPRKPPFKATLLIDCGFDNLMTDKEIMSMQQQIAYCHSINKNANPRFQSLFVTSVRGRLAQRFREAYKLSEHLNWKGTHISERSWQDLAASNELHPAPSTSPSKDSTDAELPKEKLIYLTADSPDVLHELEEGCTYIIGGLVDRNRHKNICFNRATEAGIRHAQLPIGHLVSRKVLTVNQVVDILAGWVRERDWGKACEAALPLRKVREKTGAEQQTGAKDQAGSGEISLASSEMVPSPSGDVAAEGAPLATSTPE